MLNFTQIKSESDFCFGNALLLYNWSNSTFSRFELEWKKNTTSNQSHCQKLHPDRTKTLSCKYIDDWTFSFEDICQIFDAVKSLDSSVTCYAAPLIMAYTCLLFHMKSMIHSFKTSKLSVVLVTEPTNNKRHQIIENTRIGQRKIKMERQICTKRFQVWSISKRGCMQYISLFRVISTEGALRLPTTYDNQSHPVHPSIHIAVKI